MFRTHWGVILLGYTYTQTGIHYINFETILSVIYYECFLNIVLTVLCLSEMQYD